MCTFLKGGWVAFPRRLVEVFGGHFWLSQLLKSAVGMLRAGVRVAKPSAVHGTVPNWTALSCPTWWHYVLKSHCTESSDTPVIQLCVLPWLFVNTFQFCTKKLNA